MLRRSFLKQFGLAGAVLATPALSYAVSPLPAGKKDLSPLRLKGRVHHKGKGLPGIAVTDGFNVTLTDKNGNYELSSNKEAEFVYLTLPAGYAFPHQHGIPVFYQPINKAGASFQADFTLEKLGQDDAKHCFVVWADTQMISKSDAEQLKQQSAPDLKALVASYPAGTLFHGIGCGDLVWDKFELFQDYKEAIGITGVPFFNVIGNHDMDLDARSDEYSAKTFKQHFGPTYYSFNRGQVHYVVLDDVFFIGKAKKYIGYITENQLQWLEQDLALVKPGSTVVVSVHIPTNTGAARRLKKDEELGGTVANRKQLYQLLSPFKVHIMSGHTHVNEAWEEGNIMEHNHGTVCGAWWTGPVCSDGTPNGYGVYEVNGSELTWYYKATGAPREHQMRIYDRGAIKESPDEIVVNVWNWDKEWKVEWWEDGVAKGAMEQRISFDPLAMTLYAGADLPKKHKFIDPTLADHLFFAKPSTHAKEVTVKVTDRFKTMYQENLQMKKTI